MSNLSSFQEIVFEEVLTSTEAEQLWELAMGTVRRASREGRLEARKSAGTWLTTKSEMIRVYGEVKMEVKQKKPLPVWLQSLQSGDEVSMLKYLKKKEEAYEILRQMMKQGLEGLTPSPNDTKEIR